jgi:protocatechuate 3,4-dioxygenase beta subunit
MMAKTPTAVSRREALGVLGATAAALSAGCGGSPTGPTTSTSSATTGTTTPPAGSSTCAITPTETLGPFSNITVPTRSDVREDRTGIPLTLVITVVNVTAVCAPLSNVTVEIWQCDALGNYSEYSQPGFDGRSQTFLRGLQTTDLTGKVTFTTIYPGWYAGRATHVHVDLHINGNPVKTTQIAFPEEINAVVYATSVYAAHGQNPTRNASDTVFSDGVSSELATVTGSPSAGYTATFRVGIAL